MIKPGLWRNLEIEVYDFNKSIILDRKVMPGDKIFTDKMQSDIGVSRTPIIMALKMLEREMLITTKPRRGHYVRTFTKSEIIDVLEIREALESLRARRAARNASKIHLEKPKKYFRNMNVEGDAKELACYAREDQAFHKFIMEMAGGEFFSSVFKAYAIDMVTYHADLPGGFVRDPRETIQEHMDMIEAICNHDEDKAADLIHRHMRLGREKFIHEVKKEEKKKQGRSNR